MTIARRKSTSQSGQGKQLLALMAYVLVTCAPLFVKAQDSCRGLFQPAASLQPSGEVPSASAEAHAALSQEFQISASLAEMMGQIPRKKRKYSNEEILDVLVKEARKFLVQTGVEYREDYGAFFIRPSQKTAFNRDAQKIKEAYGAETLFDPHFLVMNYAGGFGGLADQKDGSAVLLLGLGAHTFFHQKRLFRDHPILHELRHLRFVIDLLNKVPSPFYGQITAEVGIIPDALTPDLPSYNTFLSFEELRTYQASLAYELFELSRMAKTSQSQESIKKQIEETYSQIFHLYAISRRVHQSVSKLVKLLDSGTINPTFSERHGVVRATLRSIKMDGSVLTIELPLVSAQSATDPLNSHFLRQQLVWLQHSSEFILHVSARYNQLISGLYETSPSNRMILATIKEIRRTLPRLKQGAPQPRLPLLVRGRVWLRETRQH